MKAGKKRRPTSDAVEVLHRRYYEGKPERLANLEKARADDHVARKINALRTEAGLTQRQLAKLVGTTASVICRLENADYDGHSLVMLNRIAAAMKCRVEIRFVREEGRARGVIARSMIRRSCVPDFPKLPKSRTSLTLRKKLTIAAIRHFENSRNVEVRLPNRSLKV